MSRVEDEWEALYEFDDRNPEVYDALVEMARDAKRRGHTRLGMASLWEVLRYRQDLTVEGTEGYRLNNDLRALMARKIMEHEPDLAGFFTIRKSRVD